MALPTTSIHDRAMADIAAIISALNLQGAKDANGNTIVGDIGSHVYEQMWPDESNIVFPNVLLTVEDVAEEDDDEAMNFEEEAVAYPIRILICDHNSERFQQARPTYERWRDILRYKLKGLYAGGIDPILPNTPEVWQVKIRDNMKIFDAQRPHYQFMVSGFVALCRSTTPQWRGGQPPV